MFSAVYVFHGHYLTRKSLIKIRGKLVGSGVRCTSEKLPMPVLVPSFLPASFFSSFSKIASRQGSPVGFMMRRSGTLGQTSLGLPTSEHFPQAQGWRFLRRSFTERDAAAFSPWCSWDSQPTPALRLFTPDPAQLPSENLACWVLDNYHWLD